jgi:hypothetical protein
MVRKMEMVSEMEIRKEKKMERKMEMVREIEIRKEKDGSGRLRW